MNEGSNSRAYSFNIYLEPGIILYKRKYKKIHSILADALPFALIIFFIFKYISKLFKFTEGNRIIIELLFENLKEKPILFEENKLKIGKNNYIGRLSYNNIFIREEISPKIKKKVKISDDHLGNYKYYENSPSFIINKKKNKNRNLSVSNIHNNLKPNKIISQNKKNILNINDNSNQYLIFSESKKNKDFIFNNEEKIIKNKIHKGYFSDKHIVPKKRNLIKGKLFPYKYYLCSVFIKNLDISKRNYFFSARFAKVYTFLCQLFDVTTYLTLQREFRILKNSLSEKNIKLIENFNKINVDSKNFLKDISNCIGEQKLHILAQGAKK